MKKKKKGKFLKSNHLMQLSCLDEFVNVIICIDHCRSTHVTECRTLLVTLFAIDAILAIFGRSHVFKETQNVWIL